MNNKSHLKPAFRLACLLAALVAVLALLPTDTITASPAQLGQRQQYLNEVFHGKGPQGRCVPHKIIQQFVNERQIQAKGFYIDVFGSGSLGFGREGHRKYASLHLDVEPSGQFSASRIIEVDTSLPPEERLKCWQPTAQKDVTVEFTTRFEQADTPPGLTETLLLWNAPLGESGQAFPATAIGVIRNQVFGGYMAIVAQDLVFTSMSGFLQITPMPTWLDPTDWHQVRITVSQNGALIEAAQGEHDYTTVLEVTLPDPIDEPLAFEFSLDNEIVPGVVVPITTPDTLDVAFLEMRYKSIKN